MLISTRLRDTYDVFSCTLESTTLQWRGYLPWKELLAHGFPSTVTTWQLSLDEAHREHMYHLYHPAVPSSKIKIVHVPFFWLLCKLFDLIKINVVHVIDVLFVESLTMYWHVLEHHKTRTNLRSYPNCRIYVHIYVYNKTYRSVSFVRHRPVNVNAPWCARYSSDSLMKFSSASRNIALSRKSCET